MKIVLLSIAFSFLAVFGYSQNCPTAGFTFNHTVCAGVAVNLTNTSTGASNYAWDFCSGDFSSTPSPVDNAVIVNGAMSAVPVYDGTNWYVFMVSNDAVNPLIRFDYGNSLNNTPVTNNLGNPGSAIGGTARSNISFIKENTTWYALLNDQSNSNLITYDFGSSLTNTPTASATAYAQLGNSWFQELVVDNGTVYLFVSTFGSDISVFNFGNSVLNAPVVTSLAVTGATGTSDISIKKYCDSWYGFVTGYTSNTVSRLDFGTSLANTPAVTTLTPQGAALSSPVSVTAAFDGVNWNLFLQNAHASLIRADLGTSITNVSSVGTIDANNTGIHVDVAKDSSAYFIFTASYLNGHYSTYKYEAPCSTSPAISIATSPVVTYSSSGDYIISLSAYDASGNTTSFYDTAKAGIPPVANFSAQHGCAGSSTQFHDSSTVSSGSITGWQWDFGDPGSGGANSSALQNPVHTFSTAGDYSVTLTATSNSGCTGTKISTVHIFASPVSAFSGSSGCAGVALSFTDLSTSTDSIVNQWHWDFGDSDTSNIQNPAHTYLTGGTYTVTLTVTTSAGCSNTSSQQVSITSAPIAGFTSNSTCVGLAVHFTDTSSPVPSTWDWDFGDATAHSPAQNPTHTYATGVPATYNVTLTVTGNGCSNAITLPVHISNIPVANFSHSPVNICSGNSVSFTDLSSVSGDTISTWSWNFGDPASGGNNTSAIQNPVHLFSDTGSYTVTLLVASPTSCPSVIFSQTITMHANPVAGFSFVDNGLGNPTLFTDTSHAPAGSSVTGWNWSYDDGGSDNIQNPSHTFLTFGNHTVILCITTSTGCSDCDTMVVTVIPLCATAGFTINGSACSGQPLSITNTSTDATGYLWDFCSGDFSSAPVATDNPTSGSGHIALTPIYDGSNWYAFMVNDNDSIIRFDYGNSLNNIPVANSVGNPGLLIASPLRSNMSLIKEGTNWYALLADQGASQLITYNFGNSLTNAPTASSTAYPELANAWFQELAVDSGNIYLLVSTFGTDVTVFHFGNSVLNTPTLSSFTVTGATGVSDITLHKECNHWYGYATGFSNSTIYFVDFGNSLSNTTPSVSPVALQGTALINPVSISVDYDGKDWVGFVQNINFTLIKVLLGSTYMNLSPNDTIVPLSGLGNGIYVDVAKDSSAYYVFTTNYSTGFFGTIKYEAPCNTSPSVSNVQSPSVTYTSSGTYYISLNAINSYGLSQHADSVVVSPLPFANFAAQHACAGDATQFSDSTTISSGTITGWQWDFGDPGSGADNSSVLQNPVHNFSSSGDYTVTLTVTSASGCSNTKSEVIHVFAPPVSAFSGSSGCAGLALPFTDLSTSSDSSINQWHWDFGDTDTSNVQNPTHLYLIGGTYTVTLTVITTVGCSNTSSQTVTITSAPIANFTSDSTCVGLAVHFTDTSSPLPSSWNWDFGDATAHSSLQNPTHTYATGVPATYSVTLTVTGNGCSNAITIPVHISNVPAANFIYTPASVCNGSIVSFTDLSTVSGDTISTWNWNFGDTATGGNNTSSIQNPVHLFSDTGSYNVTLLVTSPTSCPGIAFQQTVTVHEGPVAGFSFTDNGLGNPTQFTDTSHAPAGSSIITWNWYYDDGGTDNIQNPSHTFIAYGNHTVILCVTTDAGCSDCDTMVVTVTSQCASAGFTISGAVCEGQPFSLTNSSINATGYLWDFCSGDFSSAPVETDYPTPGSGHIALTPIYDGSAWYAFMVNDNDSIIRFDYGNSLNNTPVANTLGNPGSLIASPLRSNMSFIKEGANWYALLADQGASQLITYDFGSSLTNTPTATATQYSVLANAWFQTLAVDNGNIYLLVSTFGTDVAVFNFGTSVLNAPILSGFTVTGADGVSDISLHNECNHWSGYVTGFANNSLSFIDFGSSLSNTPSVSPVALQGAFLVNPVSITVDYDGKDWVGFVQNINATLLRIQLGNTYMNLAPNDTIVPLTGSGYGINVDMAKDSSAYYLFTTNYGSGFFGTVKYEAPCSTVPPISNAASPSLIYASAGTYYVSLSAINSFGVGLHLDSAVVTPFPAAHFATQHSCAGDLTQFSDSSTIASGSITGWDWNFGDPASGANNTSALQNPLHNFSSSGDYTVTLTVTSANGCSNTVSTVIHIFASPVSSFNAASGCAGTALPFTDLSTSTDSIINQWHWDFGDTDTSNVQNSTHIYLIGGTYTVNLTVTTSAGCSNTSSQIVSITSAPIANFTVDSTCIGQSVHFTDTSSPIPSTWNWDFGDATSSSSIQNPTHTYPSSAPANYDVTLTVTGNGCSNSITVPVHISNVPSANFSYSPFNVCNGSSVSFTDLSTVTGDTVSTWNWNFGDPLSGANNSSGIQNPVHLFSDTGSFIITLIVSSPTSCFSAPFSQTITVHPGPVAGFSFIDNGLGYPTQFTDTSHAPPGTTITAWNWSYDDGLTDNIQNPSHTFIAYGNHTVILCVTTDAGCSDCDTMVVPVTPQCATAAFAMPDTMCSAQSLNITNTSTYATTYLWDFCSGDFSSIPTITTNPTISVGPIAATPVFDGTDWHVFLVNDNDSIIRFDYGNSLKNVPVATSLGNPGSFIASPLRANMSFIKEGTSWYALLTDQGGGANQLITYDFGNSLLNTPTASSAQYSALASSWFQTLAVDNGNIYLLVGTFGTDVAMFNFGNSVLNTPTVSGFSVTGASGVSDISVVRDCNHWYGFAAGASSNTISFLDFGNSLANTPSISNVAVTGSLVVAPQSVTAAFDGVNWDLFIQNAHSTLVRAELGRTINNLIPAGSLIASNTGIHVEIAKDSSAYFVFTSSYLNGNFSTLKYERQCHVQGDAISNVPSPSVTYTSGGLNYVSLSASNSFGVNQHLDSVVVLYSPVANFAFHETCLGDTTIFNDATYVIGGTLSSWHWDFGDPASGINNTSFVESPVHHFDTAGYYNVTLIATSNNGCTNTISIVVRIAPVPMASFSSTNACAHTLLNFIDNSTLSTGSISNWHWDFGNGDTSNVQNPVYAYPDSGNFTVTLTVTSDGSCSNSKSLVDTIAPSPVAAFLTTNTCINQAVNFIDQTTSEIPVALYHWDLGDGNTFNSNNPPPHTYSAIDTATYTVTLIVQTNNGCADTLIKPIHISNVPTADFSFVPPISCTDNDILFTDLSTGIEDTVSAWHWDYGDSFTDSVKNPTHSYATSGTYTVTLVAFTPTSCPSSPITHSLTVLQSPTAYFGYTPVCLGSPVQFVDSSTAPVGGSISLYYWQYDDGGFDTIPSPSHLFTTAGYHTVKLTIASDNECPSIYIKRVLVHGHPLASFTHGPACTSISSCFTNTSIIDITSDDTLAAYSSFHWDFGDPFVTTDTSSQQSPCYTFAPFTTGPHTITLIVQNNYGCSDTLVRIVTVNQSVSAQFTYDTTCFGSFMSFINMSGSANNDSIWRWNFGDAPGIQSVLENPIHFYVAPGSYYVTLTAISYGGCVSTANRWVNVNPLPIASFSTAGACVNNTYQFIDNSTVSGGYINHWHWSIDGLASFNVQNPTVVFDTLRTYSVSLTVASPAGCVDSVRHDVVVHPLPVPNFSFNPQYGPPPLTVSFTNITSPSNSIYQWNFGDATSGSVSTNPQHTYQDTGRFTMQLIATTPFGCVDSISKSIYVIKPLLDVAVKDVSSSWNGLQLNISAVIANLGTLDIDSVIMQAKLDNGTIIQEVYRQLLPNGANGVQDYNFAASFTVSPLSDVKFFCVQALKPNNNDDDVPANNEKCKTLVSDFSVMYPFPNPFSNVLNINIILPYDGQITIELFNSLGQQMSKLYDAQGEAGLNAIHSDMSSFDEGMYALRISFRDRSVVRQVLLRK